MICPHCGAEISQTVIAREMGKVKSEAKAKTSAENGKDQRPHVVKVRHFESIFPHSLDSNEWLDKFDVTIKGRKTTYNPDYWCPALDSYIECATSKPNISEQGDKWAQAIRGGVKLKVYWWEGEDITDQIARRKGG